MSERKGATRDLANEIFGDFLSSSVTSSTLLPVELPCYDFVEKVKRKSGTGVLRYTVFDPFA